MWVGLIQSVEGRKRKRLLADCLRPRLQHQLFPGFAICWPALQISYLPIPQSLEPIFKQLSCIKHMCVSTLTHYWYCFSGKTPQQIPSSTSICLIPSSTSICLRAPSGKQVQVLAMGSRAGLRWNEERGQRQGATCGCYTWPLIPEAKIIWVWGQWFPGDQFWSLCNARQKCGSKERKSARDYLKMRANIKDISLFLIQL